MSMTLPKGGDLLQAQYGAAFQGTNLLGCSRCSRRALRASSPTWTTAPATSSSVGGVPVAFIDFDLARPTTRLNDIANALYWWAPLLHPTDRAPSLVTARVPERVAAFADAYGMTREQRAALMPLAIKRVHNSHLTARRAADVDPVFRRWWEQGVKDRMPRAEAWTAQVADEITDRLLRGTED